MSKTDPHNLRERIAPGVKFTTPHESDACVASGTPDELGNFLAIDSEGVECMFGLAMVLPESIS